MQNHHDPKEAMRLATARESFSGRLLTDPQFSEAIAITGIIEREIKRSGAFKEKLGDYAYAFSRTEKFDAMKAETVLRDLFKERTGQTMNQMRENLVEREQSLSDDQRQQAYQAACDIAPMMEQGDKMAFHRACSTQAQKLAEEFGITDAAARRTMSEEFKAAEGIELYDWGKELDEQFYRPQIEAEKAEREKPAQGRTKTATRTRGPVRAGPR